MSIRSGSCVENVTVRLSNDVRQPRPQDAELDVEGRDLEAERGRSHVKSADRRGQVSRGSHFQRPHSSIDRGSVTTLTSPERSTGS